MKEPSVWRRVQTLRGLRKFDHLFIDAFDESWVAEAIVASANNLGAVLAKPRITSIPSRFDNLFQDDTYRVVWNCHGFIVERKVDGHPITQSTVNSALAERLLVQLYWARVGR